MTVLLEAATARSVPARRLILTPTLNGYENNQQTLATTLRVLISLVHYAGPKVYTLHSFNSSLAQHWNNQNSSTHKHFTGF